MHVNSIKMLLKADSHLPKNDESPLKKMKTAFYFILKAYFVLNIFEFKSWLFGHVEKIAC